jgi:heat shock protein HslJ
LNKTRWKLTEWTLSSLNPADFMITAEFADGRISGKSGVNSYSGTCKLGPGKAFAGSTMRCLYAPMPNIAMPPL